MVERLNGESLDNYIKRIYKHKDTLDITWGRFAELVEEQFGLKVHQDWIRHACYLFNHSDVIEEVSFETRILSISDQHYPYNLPVEVLADYKDKVDILQINGDEQDCFSLSKFTKKYRLPFVEEMIGARQMLIDTINLIRPKKVIINYGNHNERLINYFSNKIHEDLLELMPQTNLDFIVDLGFWQNNHQDKSRTFYEPLTEVFKEEGIEVIYTKNWWCKIGQTLFVHPKAYKSGILGTSEKAYLHFVQMGEQFNSLVMAHTHATSMTRYGNAYLFEQGSLCKPMSYASDGRLTRPQSNGFVYLVQDKEGNLIYDKSKLVCL